MPKRAFNLAKLVASEFGDASNYELVKAYQVKYGNDPAPSLTDDDLRADLRKAFRPIDGQMPTTASPPNESLPPVPPSALGRIPNLRPSGKWEGRMRRVTIHKTDPMSKSEGYKVGWDGVLWAIQYEQPVNMPWPYWQSLLNTDFIDDRSEDVTEWKQGDDKRLYAIRHPRAIKTVRYTDHGDVPGTESLPTCYAEYFQREALRTGCFAGMSRSAIVMVYNILFDPQSAEFFRDMRDDDIRLKIAARLGPDVEAVMIGQVYAEAV